MSLISISIVWEKSIHLFCPSIGSPHEIDHFPRIWAVGENKVRILLPRNRLYTFQGTAKDTLQLNFRLTFVQRKLSFVWIKTQLLNPASTVGDDGIN